MAHRSLTMHTMISWPAIVVLLVTLLAALLTRKILPGQPGATRNVALDGLRGYLAFGVFLHHAAIWYLFMHGAEWNLPASGVFRQLGEHCVEFFFMITAFLFVGKILDARQRPIDWLKLYVGRVLRIVPLYLLAILTLCVLVGIDTGWEAHEPVGELVRHVGQWLSFNFVRESNINGHPLTPVFIAFVIWSIKYEWLFYLSLPIIATLLRVRTPVVLVAVCAALLTLSCIYQQGLSFHFSFVLGALAAVVARNDRLAEAFRTRAAALLALGAFALLLFVGVPEYVALTIMFVPLCAVACGNGLFGILTNDAAVEMGDISYGVYLFHGLALSGTIMLIVGPRRSAGMDEGAYWMLISVVSIGLVIATAILHRVVEKPALAQVSRWSNAIRALFVRARAGSASVQIDVGRSPEA